MNTLRPLQIVCSTTSLAILAACATTQSAAPTPTQPAPAATTTAAAPPPITNTPAATLPVPFEPLPSTQPLLPVMVETKLPTVSLRLVFRTGSVDDPPGREGLTALTTRLLLEGGTKKLDSAKFQEALYPMAAELNGDTDREFTSITGRVHKDQWAEYLKLATDALVSPRFDAKDFERLKAEQLNALRNRLRQENDEDLSRAGLDALLAEGHPYRHPPVGTEAGLQAITLDDVKNHWKRTFTQDRLVLGVASDDPQAAAKAFLRFDTLPPTGAQRAAFPALAGQHGRTLILKRDTQSTAGAFGFSTPIRRGAKDFVALFIAMSAFGEHRQEHGVLYQEVRDRRGLNYGTYAYAQHYRQDGWESIPRPNVLRSQQDISVWLRPVQPQNAVFATRAVFYFLEKYRREPLPAERFEAARGFLMGATRLWVSTDLRRLGWAIDDRLADTNDFLASVRETLATITPADVQHTLQTYVSPGEFNFVYVTKDAEGLATALTNGSPSPITYPSPKPADVTKEDEPIASTPLPIRKEQLQILDAAQFMAR